MNWTRVDDQDDDGNYRVRFMLVTPPNFDFEVRATKFGVQLTGTTPYYTDWTTVNQKITWAQYVAQRLKETGEVIPQSRLERGEI